MEMYRHTQVIIVQTQLLLYSVWMWMPDNIITLFQHCSYAENDSLIYIHLKLTTRSIYYALVGHIRYRYHPHDCCNWHTKPCTDLNCIRFLMPWTLQTLQWISSADSYDRASMTLEVICQQPYISYKNMRAQVAAPQLQLHPSRHQTLFG